MISKLICKIWGHKIAVLDAATVSWTYCKRCSQYLRIMNK